MHEGLLALVGKTVGQGRFRLDRVLGHGGMGAVFAAVEVATGRAVAIKLMHPGLAEESAAMKRFQREAEVTTRLSHPHVVEVIAAGGGQGEPPFIAMELLEGASLSERLKRGETFDAQRAVRIARQVLAAVAAGHAIGVVHRDLKPANVMLVSGPGGEEIAKVVDYGVARLAMSDAMTRLTATGQVVGTPSYMSPQQAMGEPVGPEADIYAVGAILHRLVAGEPPYGSGQYIDLLKRMVVDERSRIQERVEGLGRLGEIIERAVAYEPEARYQSADEMNDALASIDAKAKTTILDWRPPPDLASLRLPAAADDPPVREPRPKTEAHVGAPRASRARPLLVFVLFAFIALGGGLGTWLWFDATHGDVPSPELTSPSSPIIAPTEAVALVAPEEPVARDAGGDAREDAHATTRSAETGMRSQIARRVRRLAVVNFTGGDLGSRRDTIRMSLGDRADLSACWPLGAPVPPNFNRGADLRIELDQWGAVQSVETTSAYPEFNRCATHKLERVQFRFGEAETVVLHYSFFQAL